MTYAFLEQELRYQRLSALGKAVDYAGKDFEQFDLRPFLEYIWPVLTFREARPRALEYGTGTGPGACFLARRGLQVDAIDISPTAIHLARMFAAQRNLEINYQVEDICNFSCPERRYDLVVDNFCLLRVITDERRRRALAVVRSTLKPTGYFVLGTSIFRAGRYNSGDYVDAATGIIYREVEALPPETCDDVLEWNGRLLYALARHVRPEAFRAELEQAGFRILWQAGGRVLCQVNDEA
jgi:SAM-dependent methyltransferase